MAIVGSAHAEVLPEGVADEQEREGGQNALDDEFGRVINVHVAEIG
jgi:hypothetical protein